MKDPVNFTIVSAPVSIHLICPHCGESIEIPWKEIDVPESWSDAWPSVECPECGEEIDLGDWEYD